MFVLVCLDWLLCRIKERAYALREARESARLALVKQKFEQQWRDANDDARTLDSQALANYMSQERLAQIEEKKRRKQELSVEEDNLLAEWNRQLDLIAEKDDLKRQKQQQADIKTSEDLKIQVRWYETDK